MKEASSNKAARLLHGKTVHTANKLQGGASLRTIHLLLNEKRGQVLGKNFLDKLMLGFNTINKSFDGLLPDWGPPRADISQATEPKSPTEVIAFDLMALRESLACHRISKMRWLDTRDTLAEGLTKRGYQPQCFAGNFQAMGKGHFGKGNRPSNE